MRQRRRLRKVRCQRGGTYPCKSAGKAAWGDFRGVPASPFYILQCASTGMSNCRSALVARNPVGSARWKATTGPRSSTHSVYMGLGPGEREGSPLFWGARVPPSSGVPSRWGLQVRQQLPRESAWKRQTRNRVTVYHGTPDTIEVDAVNSFAGSDENNDIR